MITPGFQGSFQTVSEDLSGPGYLGVPIVESTGGD